MANSEIKDVIDISESSILDFTANNTSGSKRLYAKFQASTQEYTIKDSITSSNEIKDSLTGF